MAENGWSLDAEACDFAISDKAVVRATRKLMGGKTFIDIRLVRRGKGENWFRTYKGLCLNVEFWNKSLKKFIDNGFIIPSE